MEEKEPFTVLGTIECFSTNNKDQEAENEMCGGLQGAGRYITAIEGNIAPKLAKLDKT